MPMYKLAQPAEDEEQDFPEIVGSKDLRESFKDGNRVRGSFFINGYEFHQFESNSIDNLVAQLNARQNRTHVRASIDDGYKLVLEANSPAPISIRQGAAWVDPPPAVGSGDAADQVLQKLKQAADKDANKDDDGNPKNGILEALGLEATDDEHGVATGPGVPPAGMSAEDRKKAREQRAAGDGQAPGQMFGDTVGTGTSPSAGTAGMTDTVPTEPSAPITGTNDGKMSDGRDRQGQGAGYSAKPDGTPPVRGTPAYAAGQGQDTDKNVPHRPNPQSP